MLAPHSIGMVDHPVFHSLKDGDRVALPVKADQCPNSLAWGVVSTTYGVDENPDYVLFRVTVVECRLFSPQIEDKVPDV